MVAQIFTWRVLGKLGMPAIAARLNADPARYPAPTGKGWTTQTVYAVLRQPEVHRAHGLRPDPQDRSGHRVTVPQSEWLWSPEPVHPAIVDRATWDAAQQIGAGARHQPRRRRAQPPPGRDRGPTPTGAGSGAGTAAAAWAAAAYASTAGTSVYYQCPHNPANPRHAAATPDHPRTVKAPETRLDAIAGLFFRDHVFGPAPRRSCSPPSSPPPTPPRPPTATPRSPPSPPGSGRSPTAQKP